MADPFALIPLAVAALVGGYALYKSHQEREGFRREAEHDDAVRPLDLPGVWFALALRGDDRVTARSIGGGKNSPAVWRVVVDRQNRVAARTTFVMQRENLLSRAARAVGRRDVEIGHAAFDDRFLVKAGDPDVFRGVFTVPAVRDAVRRLLDDDLLTELKLDELGALHATFERRANHFHAGKRVLLRTVALADSLEVHSDAPPVRDTQGLSLTSASSTGGSSVAIPLHVTRKDD